MTTRAHRGPAQMYAGALGGVRLQQRPAPKREPLKLRWSLRGQYPLVHEKAATCWAQLAKLGEFKGHWAGEFNFTADTFASFIHNFNEQENALPVRYGHTDDTVPAAGWLHELAVRGDWICGLLEFTDRAAEHIRKGEYRFTSIEFDTQVPNRLSGIDQGPTLFGTSLVHLPFIDGQQPLSLTP